MRLSLENIAQALKSFEPRSLPTLGRPAAVLVPLYEKRGEVRVLLTRRSQALPSHAGQISFPGGKRDPEDTSLLQTALREAHEEVGLAPTVVQPLGRLDDCPTVVSNFVITPMVGAIPSGYPFVPNHSEIDELIELPLSAFLEPGVLREMESEYQGVKYPLHFYDVGEYTVWGATARILNQLFSLIDGGLPESGRWEWQQS